MPLPPSLHLFPLHQVKVICGWNVDDYAKEICVVIAIFGKGLIIQAADIHTINHMLGTCRTRREREKRERVSSRKENARNLPVDSTLSQSFLPLTNCGSRTGC